MIIFLLLIILLQITTQLWYTVILINFINLCVCSENISMWTHADLQHTVSKM